MNIGSAPPAGALSALADPALVALAASGSDAAFETLDRRHRPAVLRQCACLLRSPHDAEEATQQAMFKAYRALDAGRAPASFLAWLMTIARNECFDMIRARKGVEALQTDVADTGASPAEHVERRERVETLKEDLHELPEAQRRALVLRGVGDLSHAEIARILGGTPVEMRTLVHEARASLAEFEAGRDLDCDVVRARIDTGDGRALRARRVRAHLRACEECSTAASRARPRRRGLGALFPLPLFGAIRAALFGGGPGGIAGTAGPVGVVSVSAAVVVSVVIGLGGGTGGGAIAADGVPDTSMGRAAGIPALSGSTTSPADAAAGAAAARARTSPQPTSAAPGAAAAPGTGTGTSPQAATPAPGGAEAQNSASPSTPGAATTTNRITVRAPSVAGVKVPGVTVPSVTVPPVTVPGVKVPPVAVPSVKVPPVTVPSVKVPPVTTPAVPIVGQVTTPSVTVPPVVTPPVQTPQIVTPPVSTPSVVVPPVVVPPVRVPPVRVPPLLP